MWEQQGCMQRDGQVGRLTASDAVRKKVTGTFGFTARVITIGLRQFWRSIRSMWVMGCSGIFRIRIYIDGSGWIGRTGSPGFKQQRSIGAVDGNGLLDPVAATDSWIRRWQRTIRASLLLNIFAILYCNRVFPAPRKRYTGYFDCCLILYHVCLH